MNNILYAFKFFQNFSFVFSIQNHYFSSPLHGSSEQQDIRGAFFAQIATDFQSAGLAVWGDFLFLKSQYH